MVIYKELKIASQSEAFLFFFSLLWVKQLVSLQLIR